jgi:Acyl CoA:acetate/3-ketoacid CoA transferase, beta subunit
LSIGDGMLAETADAVVSVPEIFNYWLQPGRIDVGFLGAAQIDKFGNINTTVIGGDYGNPKVRLPGAGGAPEIAASCREVIVVVRQNYRSFVERVDFVDLGRIRVGPGRPRAARAHRRRAQEDHHRSGRPGARSGDARVHPDRPVPRRVRHGREGTHRLGPGHRGGSGDHRRPHPAELDALRSFKHETASMGRARSHQ